MIPLLALLSLLCLSFLLGLVFGFLIGTSEPKDE
jgi:hypothetical protein